MKKLTIMAMAVCFALLLAVPAMAIDAEFGGHYEVRGFYLDNSDLDDDVGATDAFMNMRLRLTADFKITDNLTLHTRLDALDEKVWGEDQIVAGQATEDSNLSFDRCYLTAKTGIGEFIIGRFITGDFGTLFLDSGEEHEGDQIEYHLPEMMEGLDLYLWYEKREEGDFDSRNAPATQVSDQDMDDYGIGLIYKSEVVDAGIELTYTNDRATATEDTEEYFWNPYALVKLGPVNLEGEVGYKHGEVDLDVGQDRDIDKLAVHVTANADAGPVNIGVGYAYSSGDQDGPTTGDDEAMEYAEDWQPLLILTGYYNDRTLGQRSNLNHVGVDADIQNCGFNIYYVAASFAPTEDITLNFIGAYAEADETPTNVDDEFGSEFDLGVKIKLMDNLTYNATIAFLDAGDLWKWDGTRNLDDTYTFFHSLVLNF